MPDNDSAGTGTTMTKWAGNDTFCNCQGYIYPGNLWKMTLIFIINLVINED